jgi:hypothetical protein
LFYCAFYQKAVLEEVKSAITQAFSRFRRRLIVFKKTSLKNPEGVYE